MSDQEAVTPQKSSKLKTGCLWVGGVVLALAILGTLMGGDGKKVAPSENGSDKSIVSPNQPAPMAVTATELFKAFESNEVAAKAKYGDRLLAISGTVSGVTLDFMDKPVVSLSTPNQFMSLQASGLDADKAGTLKKGDKVTLNCGDVSEVAGTPMATDCALQTP